MRVSSRVTVQPRVCGERLRRHSRAVLSIGSVPRVRGTALSRLSQRQRRRFSPACAGNGVRGRLEYFRRAVQPRVCGERDIGVTAAMGMNGSAPRVRGTVDLRERVHELHRFSPACAGNGGVLSFEAVFMPVQPRVCGERYDPLVPSIVIPGSAPRVRGTAIQSLIIRSRHRFSPACAGNGRFSSQTRAIRAVQPRVCGERSYPSCVRNDRAGSAPRVRGTDMLPSR